MDMFNRHKDKHKNWLPLDGTVNYYCNLWTTRTSRLLSQPVVNCLQLKPTQQKKETFIEIDSNILIIFAHYRFLMGAVYIFI